MTTASSHLDHPTEATPDYGTVQIFGQLVGAAEHWVEDDVHVLRGIEFDVVAGDPDFQTAVEQFGEKTEDLWSYLSNLERVTKNENETFLLLAARFLAIYRELERREADRQRKRLTVNLRLRQRGARHLRHWHPRSTPVSV